MDLSFVPLLQTQRELYRMPGGLERFKAYLSTMVDGETGDLALPLVAMNPMGKDHVPDLLDTLIALDADAAGAATVATLSAVLGDRPGRFRVGLVVADDAHGGWTNRYCTEFSHRFEGRALYRRGWVVGLVWTSESPDRRTVVEEVGTVVHRVEYVNEHGPAVTLGQMLAQEGRAMALAGCGAPRLEADDLDYTREVVEPLREATDRATIMACLFGDGAATALGYRPQGLTERAGLALALHDARAALPRASGVHGVAS